MTPNFVDLAIEHWQMRRSDRVFSYTQKGVGVAVAAGVPPEKVTALMNSMDVSILLDAYRNLESSEIEAIQDHYSLTPGKTFGFIGRLDPEKRIDFLVEVLDHIWQEDREIKFLIGGRGGQQDLLTAAVGRGQVHMLGYAGPSEKAMTLRLSQGLVNPGGIGLVAVECLAIGLPICTATVNSHGPEFDYLEVGKDVFVSRDEVSDFARLILAHTKTAGSLPEHVGRPYPTIDEMIQRFADGIKEMLE